jgi:proteasome lid subunit RPN8/RPN11
MATWQTPLCPFEIEFAPHKLDEIRIAVIDGFYAVPRGGVEVGGVLFGTHVNGRVRVTDYQKIETEYLSGPSFHLSDADREGLRKLLAEAKLQPVGWFHSHTRSTIQLTERDLALYQEFFPEPWQVALVLRPENLGPVRGGYFFRDTDGQVKADTTALEFTLQPVFLNSAAAAEEIAAAPKEIEVAPAAPPAPEEVAPPKAEVLEQIAALPARDTVPPDLFAAYSEDKPGVNHLWIVLLVMALLAAGLAGYWVATQ